MKRRWLREAAQVLAAVLVVQLCAGCAVGPDYHAPAPIEPSRWTATPLPAATAGGEQPVDRPQAFVDAADAAHAADAPEAWWTVLGSAEISALVDRALQHSPTIAAADAALRQAQALADAQRGAFFPQVQLAYSPAHGRVADVASSPLSSGASTYTLHTAQVNVGYGIDVFGGSRRALESLEAQRESQAWQWRAARLTLAANVVAAAVQEASLREQLAVTAHLSELAAHEWELLKTQQRLGAAPGAAVLSQEGLLRQTQATAAVLKKQLAQQRDLLAVLLGSAPGEMPAELRAPGWQLSSLRLPDVPLGLPARLVAQRPDVRAAEAELHSANAQVGVAVAAMLPQITLTGDYGSSATALGQLFRAGGLLWGVGANLAQPVFEGGTLLHRKRAAEAQLDAALAQYRGTVLNAFQNVADSLEAVRHDAEQQVAVSRQEVVAAAALRIAQKQLALGDISTLTLLNAEAAYGQAALAQIQVRASRCADVAAVYQALGGSWTDPLPPTVSMTENVK